jgi:Putative metallopeptidase
MKTAITTSLIVAIAAITLCCAGKTGTRFPLAKTPVVAYYQGKYPVRDITMASDVLKYGTELAKESNVGTIQFVDCGTVNAFYIPASNTVVVCNEIAFFVGIYAGHEYVGPVLRYVVLHELTHAVIRHRNLHIQVYEESVADQLAAMILIENGHADDVIDSVAWFLLLEAAGGVDAPTDPHLSPARRRQDLLCLAVGSDPVGQLGPTLEMGIGLDKALGCPSDYSEARTYWKSLGLL